MNGLVLVSGLGRCGTSLLMQMLSAGGWPVYDPSEANWPDFEHGANKGRVGLKADASGLLKWIDPQVVRPPRPRGAIFLHRDPREQAKSAFKMLGVPATRAQIFGLSERLKFDTRGARKALQSRGPTFSLDFEDLVGRPREILQSIASWLEEPLDVARAICELRPRETGAKCLPYRLEDRLVLEERARAS